ncbi:MULTISPECIES: ABC transporter ATPase [Glaesserella]|uniref:ABC transporter ATPase n=1 Tax=Glaesserella australis TaxID=2094024 RepID=A0A328C234_9PAST|nr:MULTISPECIES: ABC transporter ATPase [Glaesserella]AUI67159.1 ABC transporter ATPase [Glaesserella sp. 15-184]RAL19120.1 ABC transporter ATPase [Glaesserella australis]
MLRKIILLPLFLTGCVVTQPQFSIPDQVNFQGKTYEKVTQNQIDEMQQSLFLPQGSHQTPDQWQQGILLFTDKNSQQKSLAERVALRQQTFAQQPETKATVGIVRDELQSQVLYPPTARFNDYQLEVSRGRESQCGYSQMQWSDKRSVSAKKSPNQTAYLHELQQMALQFSQLAWQIECR